VVRDISVFGRKSNQLRLRKHGSMGQRVRPSHIIELKQVFLDFVRGGERSGISYGVKPSPHPLLTPNKSTVSRVFNPSFGSGLSSALLQSSAAACMVDEMP